MAVYVIATTKSWNIENAKKLSEKYPDDSFVTVSDKNELTKDFLEGLKPRYVFFPHWSWIIPQEIFEGFECIVFHMTDLPFGRGGSPLQNLLVRGIYETKISAIKVEEGLDTGPVYMKEPADISEGNANEIFKKISDIIFEKMIPNFIENDIKPVRQEGEIVSFKRRTPKESEIPDGLTTRQLYDFIRMLDGEGYPAAYRDMGEYRFTYRNASFDGDVINAQVTVTRRDD